MNGPKPPTLDLKFVFRTSRFESGFLLHTATWMLSNPSSTWRGAPPSFFIEPTLGAHDPSLPLLSPLARFLLLPLHESSSESLFKPWLPNLQNSGPSPWIPRPTTPILLAPPVLPLAPMPFLLPLRAQPTPEVEFLPLALLSYARTSPLDPTSKRVHFESHPKLGKGQRLRQSGRPQSGSCSCSVASNIRLPRGEVRRKSAVDRQMPVCSHPSKHKDAKMRTTQKMPSCLRAKWMVHALSTGQGNGS